VGGWEKFQKQKKEIGWGVRGEKKTKIRGKIL
jgi:hypothetical protein